MRGRSPLATCNHRLESEAASGKWRTSPCAAALAGALGLLVGVDSAPGAPGPAPVPLQEEGGEPAENPLITKAFLKLREGDYDGAIALADAALKADPEEVRAFLVRGIARQFKGEDAKALDDFAAGNSMAPGATVFLRCRAELLIKMKRLDDALSEIEAALAFDEKDAEALLLRARVRTARKEFDAAAADHGAAVAADPTSPKPLALRADFRSDRGDLPGAVEDYTRAIALDPASARLLGARGSTRMRMSDYDGAIEDFGKAAGLDPKMTSLFRDRGRARLNKGDFAGAAVDAGKVIELDAKQWGGWELRARARMYAAKPDLEGALADATKALELGPNVSQVYATLADAKAAKGDAVGALAVLEKGVEALPESASTRRGRGQWLYAKRSWAESLRDFRKTCELDPEDQDYERLWIWILRVRLGEKDAGTKELAEWLKTRPSSGWDDAWFRQIASFLVGTVSEADFLKSAEVKEPLRARERRCEAAFYAGAKRAASGDATGAVPLFRRCLDTGVKNYFEYEGAVAELRALGK